MHLTILSIIGIVIALWVTAAFAVRAIGGNITLVDDWRKAWKWYSAYGIVLLGLLPDVFNALLASDVFAGTPIDEKFNWLAKATAAFVLLKRLVDQKAKPALPTWTPPDSEG